MSTAKVLWISISIHALREEGDQDFTEAPQNLAISIHALREEGDILWKNFKRFMGISIHALREEGDLHRDAELKPSMDISIHALREEGDGRRRRKKTIQRHFYPRPPRGGRHHQHESGHPDQ